MSSDPATHEGQEYFRCTRCCHFVNTTEWDAHARQCTKEDEECCRTIRMLARERYANPSDDDVEVDDNASVDIGEEGSWVGAVVWIPHTDWQVGDV